MANSFTTQTEPYRKPPMLEDLQGLNVTTESTKAVAALNRFIQQSLNYGNEAETAISQAIQADPNCAIINAYAAAFYLSQENMSDRQRAIPYLRAAHQYKTSATEREQLYVEAISAWASGYINRAIACHETIADQFPQDLLSVQQGQYHYFYQGDAVRLLQIAERALTVNPNHPELLGMVAFGLEQCHQLQQAEWMGRQATALKRQNPWAHHAVAHVLETQKRTEEGIAWMMAVSDTWEACNSMLYTHNWWHVALFYLKQGAIVEVLALYEDRIWGRARQHSPKDQVGAISLLLRLELQGVNVERQWAELALVLQHRIHEHALPFQDLHYIYALARSNPSKAYEMLVSMVAYAHRLDSLQRRRWLEIAVPAARAMIAHALGNWQEVIDRFKPVLPSLWQLGGSHTQRYLFKQVYLNALQQSEQSYRHRPEQFTLSSQFQLRAS